MLEELPQGRIHERLCRLANMRRRLEALAALGLTFADLEEVLILLGGDGNAEELLDAPLRSDPTYSPGPTRFSDGSWRVFYGSTDWNTAETEVGHHVVKAAVGTPAPLHYQRLECTMDGNGYDLRTHVAVWPFLVDPNEEAAYPDCQALAREARDRDAEGLLSRSARLVGGTNVPVFTRRALSAPVIAGSAAIIQEGHTYRVERRPT